MYLMEHELTDLDQAILERMDDDRWTTRGEIATLLERKGGKLSHYDTERLEKLSEAGYIEIATQAIGTVKKQYVYRKLRR